MDIDEELRYERPDMLPAQLYSFPAMFSSLFTLSKKKSNQGFEYFSLPLFLSLRVMIPSDLSFSKTDTLELESSKMFSRVMQ